MSAVGRKTSIGAMVSPKMRCYTPSNYGIQPCGEAVTNMERLEAAFIIPTMEFNEALRAVHFEHDQAALRIEPGLVGAI